MGTNPKNIEAVLEIGPVIPVVIIEDASLALPLVEAILKGGIKVIEVTLRTEAAIEAVRVIAKASTDITIGVGTVLRPEQLKIAKDAGAAFAVSPGFTEALVESAASLDLPYLPGAITPSEIMRGHELGLNCFKFFPAEASGGVAAIQALSEPLPFAKFCATGGIRQKNFCEYLDNPAVASVGGVWPATPEAIAAGNWDAVTESCRNIVSAMAGR